MTREENREIVKAAMASLTRENPTGTFELKSVLPDSEVRWYQFTIRMICDELDQTVEFQGVGRDLTAEKTISSERREMEIKMLTTSKLATLGEMATGMAHEINQPLNYISIFLQNLQADPQVRADSVKRANRCVDRITEIIDHLRMFGRSDTKREMPVDIGTVLNNALILMQNQLRSLGITLEQNVPDHLPKILGNENQLEQVLINLFQNAMDALDSRQGEKKITVDVAASDDGKSVVIKFADNGSGMPDHVREKIFEPFYTTKKVGKGTGLGLSIVYGIITDMGGSVSCESEEGEGTVIKIEGLRVKDEG